MADVDDSDLTAMMGEIAAITEWIPGRFGPHSLCSIDDEEDPIYIVFLSREYISIDARNYRKVPGTKAPWSRRKVGFGRENICRWEDVADVVEWMGQVTARMKR